MRGDGPPVGSPCLPHLGRARLPRSLLMAGRKKVRSGGPPKGGTPNGSSLEFRLQAVWEGFRGSATATCSLPNQSGRSGSPLGWQGSLAKSATQGGWSRQPSRNWIYLGKVTARQSPCRRVERQSTAFDAASLGKSPQRRQRTTGVGVSNQTPARRPVESPCRSIPSTPILSAMLRNRLVSGAGSVLR